MKLNSIRKRRRYLRVSHFILSLAFVFPFGTLAAKETDLDQWLGTELTGRLEPDLQKIDWLFGDVVSASKKPVMPGKLFGVFLFVNSNLLGLQQGVEGDCATGGRGIVTMNESQGADVLIGRFERCTASDRERLRLQLDGTLSATSYRRVPTVQDPIRIRATLTEFSLHVSESGNSVPGFGFTSLSGQLVCGPEKNEEGS
ncbi:hypothetical protein SAMN06265795_11676 [Noviherbaspirillum humi]|uniref:Uncharacterized protein n=1 Tax=Noviherbaspirillum humi TaxID=1688639 RepID=A0A239KLE2_9BURK|nr:hypothetical protein [Noviherbaspirillum humi]SNT18981.1 hypothetical protein SAMN06265795_11676 [Noviherbaspirillum humi]